MKTPVILLAISLIINSVSFSQKNINSDTVTQLIFSNPSTDNWTVEDYKKRVKEIQIKIDWVKSNPEEHKKAMESGWYEMANKTLEEAKYELSCIQNKEGNNNKPVYIDTGNPEEDQRKYKEAKEKWIKEHPEEYQDMQKADKIIISKSEFDDMSEEKRKHILSQPDKYIIQE